MYLQNHIDAEGDVAELFARAAAVGDWPRHLPHYRRVRFLRRDSGGGGLVEMAAVRRFPGLTVPLWWVSEMHLDRRVPAIRYRHVAGITRGMLVEWRFEPEPGGTHIRVTHIWRPGRWRRAFVEKVAGPLFIAPTCDLTLQGLTYLRKGVLA